MDAKKTIEVVVLGGTLVVAANSWAANNACNNGSAVSIATGGFIKVGFTPKCSGNVYADTLDGTQSFTVKSFSAKGKQFFGGTTEGGGVTACTGATVTSTDTSVSAAAGGCS